MAREGPGHFFGPIGRDDGPRRLEQQGFAGVAVFDQAEGRLKGQGSFPEGRRFGSPPSEIMHRAAWQSPTLERLANAGASAFKAPSWTRTALRCRQNFREGDFMALVLFSGGQDSTTCLAWALERYDRVETLGFDYGQRHRIELEPARRPARRPGEAQARLGGEAGPGPCARSRGARRHFGHRADARDRAIEMGEKDLPNTFVPGRNLIFLDLRRGAGLSARYRAIWSAACARPIFPAIPIAATTRSRPCRSR